MNSSLRAIIDNALDDSQTHLEYETLAPAPSAYEDDIVKLANALEFVGGNLHNIGTDEEKIAELYELQVKLANIGFDAPGGGVTVSQPSTTGGTTTGTTGGTTTPQKVDYKGTQVTQAQLDDMRSAKPTMKVVDGKVVNLTTEEAAEQAAKRSTGVGQALKNTWKGQTEFAKGMGGHAGKAAILGGGALLGLGAMKALGGGQNKQSSLDLSNLSDEEVFVMSKSASLHGVDLESYILVKEAALAGEIDFYEGLELVKEAGPFGDATKEVFGRVKDKIMYGDSNLRDREKALMDREAKLTAEKSTAEAKSFKNRATGSAKQEAGYAVQRKKNIDLQNSIKKQEKRLRKAKSKGAPLDQIDLLEQQLNKTKADLKSGEKVLTDAGQSLSGPTASQKDLDKFRTRELKQKGRAKSLGRKIQGLELERQNLRTTDAGGLVGMKNRLVKRLSRADANLKAGATPGNIATKIVEGPGKATRYVGGQLSQAGQGIREFFAKRKAAKDARKAAKQSKALPAPVAKTAPAPVAKAAPAPAAVPALPPAPKPKASGGLLGRLSKNKKALAVLGGVTTGAGLAAMLNKGRKKTASLAETRGLVKEAHYFGLDVDDYVAVGTEAFELDYDLGNYIEMTKEASLHGLHTLEFTDYIIDLSEELGIEPYDLYGMSKLASAEGFTLEEFDEIIKESGLKEQLTTMPTFKKGFQKLKGLFRRGNKGVKEVVEKAAPTAEKAVEETAKKGLSTGAKIGIGAGAAALAGGAALMNKKDNANYAKEREMAQQGAMKSAAYLNGYRSKMYRNDSYGKKKAAALREQINSDMKSYVKNVGTGYNLAEYLKAR